MFGKKDKDKKEKEKSKDKDKDKKGKSKTKDDDDSGDLLGSKKNISLKLTTSEKELLKAMKTGKPSEVAKAMKKKDLNLNFGNGLALWQAIQDKQLEIFKLLVDSGASPDCKHEETGVRKRQTLLHVAVTEYKPEFIQLLISYKVPLNIRDGDEFTPLHLAATAGHADIVQLLIKSGADVNSRTKDDWTVLHSAAQAGYIDVVKILLENGADPMRQSGGKLAIDVAWKTEVKDLIAQLGVSLWSACNTGDVSAVKTILSAGTVEINKVNADGSSPLWIACRHGYLEVVKILLGRKGCIIDWTHQKNGTTPLFAAVQSGSAEVVTYLLERKAQVTFENKQGSTLLHVASINGHANLVDLLLSRPDFMMAVPINEQDNDGATSLFLAAQNGHTAVVELLLKNFASIEIRDTSGMSPLDVAIKNEHQSVIKILGEHLKELLPSDKEQCILQEKKLVDIRFAALVAKGAEAAAANNQPITVHCTYLVTGKAVTVQLLPGMGITEFRDQVLTAFAVSSEKVVTLAYQDADKDRLLLEDNDDLRDFVLSCPTKAVQILE